MVYQYLTFEEMDQLMKHQIMSSSSSPSGSEPSSTCNVAHVPNTASSNPSWPQGPSENNLLMQCMQKLCQYPAPNTRVILQENNGQTAAGSRSLAKGEGGGDHDQHATGGGSGGGGGAGCIPRPRWCPTPEQIQVLETLFNSGTTTPSRDMIVEIAACLKQFGSIVEANVFYWFQNRKARAKRKLRMQAQLQQQQSGAVSRPMEANQPHPAPPQVSQSAVNAAPTGRRLCTKTTSKTSPSVFAVPDYHHHQLPPLVNHLPAAVHNADHIAAVTCSMLGMHDSTHDQHAGGVCSIIMPQQLYAAEDCNSSLHVSSGDMICGSGTADHISQCDSGCAAIPTNPSLGEHTLHQGLSQANMPSQIMCGGPPAPLLDHADHCYNVVHDIRSCCDQYVGNISSYNSTSTKASSRPGSADGSNVINDGACGLAHPMLQEAPAAQTAASIHSYLYQAAAADFAEPALENLQELSAGTHTSYGDSFTTITPAYTSASTSGSSCPEQMQKVSLSLPRKRSWVEALMEQLAHPQSTTTSITQNTMYGDVDHYARRVHPHDLLSNPVLLHHRQVPTSSSQDASITYTTPIIADLSKDALQPTHPATSATEEPNTGSDTNHASWFHDAIFTTKKQRAMEPLMACNPTLAMLQQQGLSPPIPHHCDHLPLWEALAPFMSIGSQI